MSQFLKYYTGELEISQILKSHPMCKSLSKRKMRELRSSSLSEVLGFLLSSELLFEVTNGTADEIENMFQNQSQITKSAMENNDIAFLRSYLPLFHEATKLRLKNSNLQVTDLPADLQ